MIRCNKKATKSKKISMFMSGLPYLASLALFLMTLPVSALLVTRIMSSGGGEEQEKEHAAVVGGSQEDC